MFARIATITLVLAIGGIAIGIARVLWLLGVGSHAHEWQTDATLDRCKRLWGEGLWQRRLRNEKWPGLAHQAIFFGFILLLPRMAILFGRAFDAEFASTAVGPAWRVACLSAYHWVKDFAALGVLFATGGFAYLRLAATPRRFSRGFVGLAILATIATMMLADFIYDGAGALLLLRQSGLKPSVGAFDPSALGAAFMAPFVEAQAGALAATTFMTPLTTLTVFALGNLNSETVLGIGVASYCLHLLLVLGFVVALPHTKHLHLLAIWPNLFFDVRTPISHADPLATDPDALLSAVEAAVDSGEADSARCGAIGKSSLRDFSPKQRLDWFACTACGRCTERCPAANSGKSLDPRGISGALRRHLEATPINADRRAVHLARQLLPTVIDPSALWACTNCGACEEHCPAGLRFVAPIVEIRRDQLMMRGQAPTELQRPFAGMERQGNPWNLPQQERARWTEGLAVELLRDVESVEYLYWVGCAASYDVRAQSVARALVKIMQRARVSFAILGPEEHCTGDLARRTGNELLFLQLARKNIELLSRYREAGRFKSIITACPHCLVTLGQDYAALGAAFETVSHVVAIEQWVTEGRLALDSGGPQHVTYHDPCNLARHARVTLEPRRLFAAVPRLEHSEPSRSGCHTDCCGAGGGQLWLKEDALVRTNLRRAEALSRTGATQILVACPFCLSAIEDGVKGIPSSEGAAVCDIAEFLEPHCQVPSEKCQTSALQRDSEALT